MLINARFLTQPTTGVQRFAREIIAATALKYPDRLALLAPQSVSSSDNFCGLPLSRVGRYEGHRWEQFDLPRASRDQFLINLCNTAPIFKSEQLVVLHDAAVAANPDNFTPAFRVWYHIMIHAYTRRARKLATVSNFSADEISKYFGVNRSRINIIPESGEHILRETPDYTLHEKFDLEQDGYFLAVSSLVPNKNFSAVLRAAARLPTMPFKFVIVGARNTKVFNSTDFKVTNAVEAGYVSDAQLRALYEKAACFVYPSLYEGFGLPPLEAMTCGCPVLVSNTSSLPEVCGKAALYCDPFDPGDIAQKLSSLLGSKQARKEYSAAGLARSREWTWAKAAARLRETISF